MAAVWSKFYPGSSDLARASATNPTATSGAPTAAPLLRGLERTCTATQHPDRRLAWRPPTEWGCYRVGSPAASERNVPPQRDARAAPGRLRGLRGWWSIGAVRGGVRTEIGVGGQLERRDTQLGDPREGVTSSPPFRLRMEVTTEAEEVTSCRGG